MARPTISPEDAYKTGSKPQKGIVCRFQHAGRGLSPWEVEEANTKFQFKGVSVGENPLNRLSFYDTDLQASIDGWDAATKREVEERLMGGMSYGSDYFLSERPAAELPYAKYLEHRKVHGQRKIEHAVADIVAAINTVGIDPSRVIAYEQDSRNKDQFNEQIIAAVEAISAETEPEPLVAA